MQPQAPSIQDVKPSRMTYLFRGVGPSEFVNTEMARASSQRMAVLLLFLMMPLAVTTQMEIAPRADMGVFFSVAGLVVLSSYMTFFQSVSSGANLFAHACFFALCQVVAGMAIASGVTPPQMFLSILLGWCVAYGLFGDGTFGSDAARFPVVILAAMVMSEFGGGVGGVIATYLMIDAFLAVVHANTVTPGTALAYIAFAGLIDMWLKISST